MGDAMLSNPPIDGTFGTMPIMRVGGKDQSLIVFDLSSLPSAAAINNAALELYISGSGSDAPVLAHRATAAWSEASVTFASYGEHYDPAVLAAFTTNSVNVRKSLDVTAQVTRWVALAQPNYGVLLETSSQKKTIFVTREGGTPEQKPNLHVCYSVPDDHCSPNPCANGGTCENGATGYTCNCTPGYTGANCATLVADCTTNPCQNGGICTNGVSGYACTCQPGYTGANCETLVDNCASNPCQNGGACLNHAGGYACQCAPGYTGSGVTPQLGAGQGAPAQLAGQPLRRRVLERPRAACSKRFSTTSSASSTLRDAQLVLLGEHVAPQRHPMHSRCAREGKALRE
jgi:hypothetical protein